MDQSTNLPTRLDQAQVDYLTDVLGLERLVVPTLITAAAAPNGREKFFEIQGSLASARLIVILPLLRSEFPLRGEAQSLLEKMIAAMKLKVSEVAIASWNIEASAGLPEEMAQVGAQAKGRPIVLFSGPQFMVKFPLLPDAGAANVALGEWSLWGQERLMPTFSLRELLSSPDEKRKTWVHLQKAMQHI
jgi:hypothetical protein